ncbi:MAG TPA: LysM peptidoglycan-binding domain-containing protein [Bacteroidales bacterium]|nr:LysM peptidoglycan-binding domain-containing protein [Bacteroidales bacterium]
MTGFEKYLKTVAILILIVISSPVQTQVVVERSKDKVIISGVPYYIHFVKKGETAYSISKAYNITVEEINKENPPAVYGIKEGQALRIPVRETEAGISQESKTNQAKRDEQKYIYHKMQPGETIYQLSRLYGISENEIVASNPGVEISRLPVNAEIAVPRRVFMSERQEFAVQDSDYIFHKVVRGESLASIAEHYGITVRDLRKENRNIRFPQVGDYIRIRALKKAAEQEKAALPLPDTLKKDDEPGKPPLLYERPAGYTPVRNLKGKMDVALLIPLYLSENSVRRDIDSSRMQNGRRIYKITPRPETWIYSGSTGFIEMYMGMLLAADTLRALGLDINIHLFDIKSDTVALTKLINSGRLSGMDLIVGPVYSHNLAIMTEWARPLGIPVVSPVPLYSNAALKDNPNLFMAHSSLEVAQDAIAGKTGEYFDSNIVFIHNDSAGVDPDIKRFKDKIFAELSDRLPWQEVRFKEFIFYSRSAFDNDSVNRLGHTLSRDIPNLVIIASEEAPVISETVQELHSLSKRFPIKVYGYPVMRMMENLEPKYFFELEMQMFSPYWIDYSRRDIRRFNASFRQKFLTEPDELSNAWLGYDIAYYFISGIAVHGSDFLAHPEIHFPDLLHTEFDFRRKTVNDGFENHRLFSIKYTRDYEVVLLPDVLQ